MKWKKRALACFIAAVMITASMNSVVAQNPTDTTNSTASTGEGSPFNAGPTFYTPADVNGFNNALAGTTASMDAAAKKIAEDIAKSEPNITVTTKDGVSRPALEINISSYRIKKADATKLFTQVADSYPELFYIEQIYTSDKDSASGNMSTVAIAYSAKGNELKRRKEVFNQGVESALSYIDDSMTDEQKVVVLHDYIVTTAHYDYAEAAIVRDDKDPLTIPYTAYGVFGDARGATCNGYALAFNVLMDKIGIDNFFIGSPEKDHAWSLIKLGSHWYHVDPTWDDSRKGDDKNLYGPVDHSNFLMSDDAMIESDHGAPYSASHSGGWKIAYGGNAPAANSSAYENEFWTSIDSTMLYNGKWYYVKNGRIRAGNDDAVIGSTEVVNTFGQWNDRIYYATDAAIHSIRFDGTDDQIVSYTSGITGMCVIGNTLYYQRGPGNAEQKITLKEAATVKSIAISTKPKTEYIEGDKFDLTGSTLKVTYSDGSIKYVSLTESMCSAPDMNKTGSQTIKVTYEGASTSFNITVNKKELSYITLDPHYTSQYKLGRDLDYASMTMVLHYNNNSTSSLPVTASMVSGYDKNTLGAQTLTLTYQGKTTTFVVEVLDKLITNIELLSKPTKTEYLEGSPLDMTGAKLKIFYDNDTNITLDEVPVSWCSGYDKDKVGVQTVTVVYNNVTGKSVQFEVTVRAKTATKFSVTPPLVTEYIEGQSFSAAGATLRIDYDNGTHETLNITEEMCSAVAMDKLGQQTVTVTWNDREVGSFSINVRAKQVTGIELIAPSTTEYLTGDTLNLQGGKVNVSYDNGIDQTIDLTDEMCSGADLSAAGTQTVTVTYEGKTASYEITVVDRQAVDDVTAQIDAIDLENLSAEDAEAIEAINQAFEKLSPFEQGRVSNSFKLSQANQKLTEILFPSIDVTEGDVTVSAEAGQFPAGTRIVITEQQAAMNASLQQLFGEDATALKAFDLSIESDAKAEANGMMTVSIQLGDEAERLALAQLDGDGKATELSEFTVADGVLTFKTDAFGRYVLVQKAEEETPDPTPDPTPSTPDPTPSGSDGKTNGSTSGKNTKTGETNPLGAVVPALMLSASAAVLLKKKREQK